MVCEKKLVSKKFRINYMPKRNRNTNGRKRYIIARVCMPRFEMLYNIYDIAWHLWPDSGTLWDLSISRLSKQAEGPCSKRATQLTEHSQWTSKSICGYRYREREIWRVRNQDDGFEIGDRAKGVRTFEKQTPHMSFLFCTEKLEI